MKTIGVETILIDRIVLKLIRHIQKGYHFNDTSQFKDFLNHHFELYDYVRMNVEDYHWEHQGFQPTGQDILAAYEMVIELISYLIRDIMDHIVRYNVRHIADIRIEHETGYIHEHASHT